MNIEQNRKADQILESLDGVRRATAPDFFYTRLKARMEREHQPQSTRPWILKPAYAVIALALVILVNLAVIVKNNTKARPAGETENYLSAAAEYNLNDIISEEVYK